MASTTRLAPRTMSPAEKDLLGPGHGLPGLESALLATSKARGHDHQVQRNLLLPLWGVQHRPGQASPLPRRRVLIWVEKRWMGPLQSG